MQLKHMHCRQTHRQVNMDYSVGRETDTTPEVCLSVGLSVCLSLRLSSVFRADDVGRSVHFADRVSNGVLSPKQQ